MTPTDKPLEALRGRFFLMGLVIACSLTLVAFEWPSKLKTSNVHYDLDTIDTGIIICIMPPVFTSIPKPPPPPSSATSSLTKTIFEITINLDTTINETQDEDLGLEDIGASEETIIEKPIPQPPRKIAEILPEFPGGEPERKAFLARHISYPLLAKENHIEGKVYIEFIVQPDGRLTDFKVALSSHPSLDKEALRVAQLMPDWIPGKHRGRNVPVWQSMPIIFRLR